MLEIGSYEGRSAVWFLENILTHPTSRLVCIDPFFDPRVEMRFDHNVRLSGARERLEKRRGRSESVLPQLERASFDLIYVDGSHDAPFVLLDAMLSWELLKTGGILAFDDYEWEPVSLLKAVPSWPSTCSSRATPEGTNCCAKPIKS